MEYKDNQEDTEDTKDTKAMEEYTKKNHPGELKDPVTEEEFLRLKHMVTLINRSLTWPKNVGQVWGPNGEFSSINSAESLRTWFESGHCKSLKIPQTISPFDLDDFEVFVFEGDLVTLSKDFKGGVGVESLWCDESSTSTGYKSLVHELNDPRRRYRFEGKRWDGKKRKKSSSEPSNSSKKRKDSAKENAS